MVKWRHLFPVHDNVPVLGENLEEDELPPYEKRRRFSCFLHRETRAESHSPPEGKPWIRVRVQDFGFRGLGFRV